MSSQIEILVFGKVQGVFYRASTRDKAARLGLSGYVMNLSDGSVKIVAQGKQDLLNELINWCHEGPRNAVVDKVVVNDCQEGEFSGFSIRR